MAASSDQHINGENGVLTLPNPHLSHLAQDGLFHLRVPLDDPDTIKEFSNVKFVCVGGTPGRLKTLALKLAKELGTERPNGTGDSSPFDFSFTTERFSGYKVGPVFCVNHGMGTPYAAIMLHEVFKLLAAARCSGVTLIRLGTCGGIGVEPGTVVVSSGALSCGMKEAYITSALGRPLELPTRVDPELVKELVDCAAANGETDALNAVVGKTYCADDFYNGQGRIDGSFCDYSKEDKHNFLEELHSLGVRNMEMESAAVLGLSAKVGVRAAVVCVVLVNRLKQDLPTLTEKEIKQVEAYPLELVTRFIKRQITKTQ